MSTHVVIPRCPQCRDQLVRSRTHGYERYLKYLTRKRPHKCPRCQWRGWRKPMPPGEVWYPELLRDDR